MPQASGWAYRGASTTASGTSGSLLISVPAGVVDGDILILGIAHRSGGYCTPPAGWTLVHQGQSATLVGEVYWRRASSEPANYTITGLATVATATMTPYVGGVTSGSVVDVASVRVATGTTRYRANALTTNQAAGLLVGVVAYAANDTTITFRTKVDADAAAGTSAPAVDPTLARLGARTAIGSASGGGCAACVFDAIQGIPGDTGQGQVSTLFGGQLSADTVGILVALLPDTTTVTTGSRYYPTFRTAAADLLGPLGGSWDATIDGPRGYGNSHFCWELSQQKSLGGEKRNRFGARNATSGANLHFKGCTPPLAAQTLGGTFDLCQFVNAVYVGTSGTLRLRYRVVVYVSVGDTTAVRATALDYTDTVDFPTGTVAWRSLAAPQPLAAVAVQAGDRVLIEWGVQIVEATLPAPTRPPTVWVRWQALQGTTYTQGGGSVTSAGPAYLDATTAFGVDTYAPWFDFSQTLVELGTAPTPLTNSTGAAAQVISSLPFTTTVNSRGSAAPQRAVWYRWTAPTTQRVIFHTLGSTGGLDVAVYDDPADAETGAVVATGTQAADRVAVTNIQIITACSSAVVDVVAGTTYWFRVRQAFDVSNAPACGGQWTVSLLAWQAPAANDVIMVSQGFIARYTQAGVLADLRASSDVLSGVAIDYTERPIVNQNDLSTHAAHRVLVGSFLSSRSVYLLDLARLNNGEAVLDSIFAVFPAAVQRVSSLAVDALGRLWAGFFGNGFLRVADGSAAYLDAPATASSASIVLTDAIHGDAQPGAPFPAGTAFAATVEAGGTNYLDLNPDGSQLSYTSGGWYVPVGGTTIYDLDPTTGALLGTRTVTAGTGPNPGLKGVQPLGDGSILVCNGSVVQRVSAAGAVLNTYTPSPASRATSLADVEIEEDGVHFWVLDEESTSLYRFNSSTGAQEVAVYTRLGYGTSTSFVIYRPNGIGPPPPPVISTACPAVLGPVAVAGGSACPVGGATLTQS